MSRYLVVAGCLAALSAARCQADDTQTELRAIREQLAHILREQQKLTAAVDALRAELAVARQNRGGTAEGFQSVPRYDNPVWNPDFKAFVDRPVPTVRAEDLRRVWTFLMSEQGQAQRSVSLNVVAGLCGPQADSMAVWLRTTLIQAVLHQGRLDPWRDGDSLRDKVFEVAAKFPLPNGPAKTDVDAFIAAMQ